LLSRDTATGRAILGEEAALWSLDTHLLALIADRTADGNWQRQQKPYAPKPKHVPRPGVDDGTRVIGKDPLPVDDFEEWLASKNAELAAKAGKSDQGG
jgi:hypothetical protein